jgi:Mn-containing catalase
MYHHVKKLMYTVRVDEPDPKFGNMLLEQFGGANGELAAAMQYSVQGLNCEDPARKDLLMDIGTEELSHLEVVGTLARLHLAPMKFKREYAEADPLIAIAGGGGVNLFNSMGDPWTADYLKVTGELDVDLRSNIAAEARAKIVYERLINFCDDVGTKDALQFLMTREITHMKALPQHSTAWARVAFPSVRSHRQSPSWTSISMTPQVRVTLVRSMQRDRGTKAETLKSLSHPRSPE